MLHSTPFRLLLPFQAFLEHKLGGSFLLLFCTATALVLANSPWAESYSALWQTPFAIGVAGKELNSDLRFWVNDLLMAVFFLVVGLEIKRELYAGELASRRQALLPVMAATGGIAVPALIYAALNARGPSLAGWAIPTATDIAFALGVLALLGDRVPIGLKVFLTAVAIVDDLAAVLVIAVFYTATISWKAVALCVLCLLVLSLTNRLGVHHTLPYLATGALLWLFTLASGVHPTVAGVALAFTIPARTRIDSQMFVTCSRELLDRFEKAVEKPGASIITDEQQQATVRALETVCAQTQAPLQRLEQRLHPWVTFAIMPLFALANAGVRIDAQALARLDESVPLGVMMGLLLGKPTGIMLGSWVALRFGLSVLPQNVTWGLMHGASWLCGIGFTMSLFITQLAFSDEVLLQEATLGVLAASSLAACIGVLILLGVTRAPGSASAGR